ncbi:MAG: AbrB/MazE/SpoVT family DNA-binding domain-containing protein [Candidatus Fermentibacteria bacterium]|nr:AbrB/MazE/SpoVT family DNA-binding domain-containing protein [Candidatus Fermentibacteria bacterium]
MITTVKKWGNSLAIRIPKVIAEELLFKNNSTVELHTDKGSLLVKSVPREYSLDTLLAEVTDENLHEEIGTGESVGREEW